MVPYVMLCNFLIRKLVWPLWLECGWKNGGNGGQKYWKFKIKMITSAVTLKKVGIYYLYRSVFIPQTNWRLPRKLITVLNNLKRLCWWENEGNNLFLNIFLSSSLGWVQLWCQCHVCFCHLICILLVKVYKILKFYGQNQ